MTDLPNQNKALLQPLLDAQKDFTIDGVKDAVDAVFQKDAICQLSFPFETMDGRDAFFDTALAPLFHALPDLERRNFILMAGSDEDGAQWVGCGGFFCGTFVRPFLDIPPTGHLVHMRFHEFYKFEDGKVTEVQALWDIPELMMQADAWPMAPSLGRQWCVPGPATQDGLVQGPYDAAKSEQSCRHIIDMLVAMKRHPVEPLEAMELPEFWHERMNWYGPAGIGTGRGMAGFRNWHQIPFLNAMPDRGQKWGNEAHHFFADGDYVGVTGWPNMAQSLTNDGWLGMAASGQKLNLRSLDFWRLEGQGDQRRIRENWVLVDLLSAYDQIGVDVLARMREFNKSRHITVPDEAWKYQ